ncbi:MAG: 50S ribosomal protein L18 [Candidatus Delongbacteria bacterium]|nr:50S ribosomal protein L18 [Candidatus Delongbacteria bacterium]
MSGSKKVTKATVEKLRRRNRRRLAIRIKVSGTGERPRIAVFRSNSQIYAQVIDDSSGKTLVSASTLEKEIAARLKDTKNRLEQSHAVGVALAERALAKDIKRVVFDRGGYIYAGRVKSLAEGARKGGLEF